MYSKIVLSNALDCLVEQLRNVLQDSHTIIVPDWTMNGWLGSRIGGNTPILSLPEALFGPTAFLQIQAMALCFGDGVVPPDRAERIGELFWQKHVWGIEQKYCLTEQEEILFSHLIRCAPVVRLPSTPIHLFGFSAISPHIYALFQSHEIFYWCLSPCMMFWADLCSDTEALSLEVSSERSEAMHQLLFDRHALLANAGMLGRDFAIFLDNRGADIVEAYCTPHIIERYPDAFDFRQEACVYREKEKRASLLSLVQADMLTLHSKRMEKLPFVHDDGSIQIHKVCTLLQEIEQLHESLTAWRHSEETVQIFAHDIERYIPAIERFFTVGEYQIIRTQLPQKHTSLISGIVVLLDLLDTRFNRDTLYRLLRNTLFAKKAMIDRDSVRLLYTAMQGGFNWGVDAEDVKWTLQQEGYCCKDTEERGTWAAFKQNATIDPPLVKAIQTLIEQRMNVRNASRRFSDWVEFFESLLSFFTNDPEETIIREALHFFRQCSQETECRFFVAKRLFMHCLKRAFIASQQITKNIVFADFGTIRNIPAHAVCLLGMNSEGFGQGKIDLCQLGYSLQRSSSSYDLEQYLFCEALLAAKELFWISFQGYSFENRSPIEPSSVVVDLLTSLDGTVQFLIKEYQETCRQRLSQSPQFFRREKRKSDPRVCIKELFQTAHSPAKLYLQKELGLFFPLQKNGQGSVDRFLEQLVYQKKQEEERELELLSKKFGFDPKKRFSIEFSAGCTAVAQVSDQEWHLPALTFSENNEVITLEGRVDGLYEQGELVLGYKNRAAHMRKWPRILLRAYVGELLGFTSRGQIYCTKNQTASSIDVDNPYERLKTFVLYTKQCQQEPIGLYPEFVDVLFDPRALSKEIAAMKKRRQKDPYLAFFLSKISLDDNNLFELWRKIGKEVYGF